MRMEGLTFGGLGISAWLDRLSLMGGWRDGLRALLLYPCPKCNGQKFKRITRRQGKGRGRVQHRPCKACRGTGEDQAMKGAFQIVESVLRGARL
jgi:hypothetical protein